METATVRSQAKVRWPLVAVLIVLGLLLIAIVAMTIWSDNMSGNVLTYNMSEPLGGATTARMNIKAGDGNLVIDSLNGGEQILAGGTLQYLEKQGEPARTVKTFMGQADFTLQAGKGGQSWFRLPWAACNGATEWQIHLNPAVVSDLTAHSDGGNVRLDLSKMAVTRVSADTGGGNIEVIMPGNVANLNVTAKTGAGNATVEIGSGTTGSSMVNASSGAGGVSVSLPAGIAARITATSGLGGSVIDPQFPKIGDNLYQSPNYDTAANKVEITLKSGAGGVSVNVK